MPKKDHKPLPNLSPEQIERFMSKVDVRGPDECWPYATSPSVHYGIFCVKKVHFAAHRIAMLIAGQDPGTLCVLHHCDNPPCCNPAHLFLGTDADNMRDMESKGRGIHPGPNVPLRGDKHWTRFHPERVPAGDQHWARRRPDKVIRGEKQWRSRLTSADVLAIRNRYASGETQYVLARDYGVGQKTISDIICHRTWKHVTAEPLGLEKGAEVDRDHREERP